MHQLKIVNWVIFCSTVLVADLLAGIIVFWVSHHSKLVNPYKATALKIVASILVFFSAFWLVESLVNALTINYATRTKKNDTNRNIRLNLGLFYRTSCPL